MFIAKTAAKKTTKTKKPVQKTAQKVRPDDMWAAIHETGKARGENGAALKETQRITQELAPGLFISRNGPPCRRAWGIKPDFRIKPDSESEGWKS
jgi:hypothetical protein